MKQVQLLQLPRDFGGWETFEGTPYADNGGEPDGSLWLQDFNVFGADELAAAVAAGAVVVSGYEVDYMPTDHPPAFDGGWCGYGSARIAYAIDYLTAVAIQRHYDLQVAAER